MSTSVGPLACLPTRAGGAHAPLLMPTTHTRRGAVMDRGLRNEHDYDRESAERSAHRLTRRQVLRAGAFTAAAAVGPTMAQSVRSRAAADVPGIVKPTPDSLFIARGTNAEMRWSAMRGQGYLTPIDRFFVRNHTSTPRIDLSTW